ncbi:MAG TPA: SDR family NAD(P)-dependent oxidoreductase [Actinotalea caeni]|uniref:SDR family NAD(P)-dependent oxidoreductase n=1 Tax=Actinotalea caeni TaxID=1348467 RepID=UPI0012E2F826|nr:SDR family NAD(P)-dependent oxidoreductase [Actinotalea caeni]HLV55298.1 SDR family NAD(P)-dependent oxidoreductase [Actinotalea caeni]
MTRALITGASSGLGAEYARQLAARGNDLVLVARSTDALETLAGELRPRGVDVEVLAADLLEPDQLARVEERLRETDRPVDVLVNNAGYGMSLAFHDNPIEDEVRHHRIHTEVPMRLIHAALPGMRARRRGAILNVASVAAFTPRSTYAAAKMWQVSLSRWASTAYRRDGVTITAVCPGYTHTDFHARLGLPPGQEGVPRWLWLEARDVVAESLRDLDRGKALSVPSTRYKAIVALLRLVPDGLAARAAARGR